MGPVPQNPSSPAGQGASGSYQGSVQERYASALRLYNENNFLAALSALQQLEVDDPNGPLKSNYHYWAGESLYALKRYSEAIQEFTTVSTNYPASLKADDALFKLGESYERMGVKSSARDAYERLNQSFPWSEYRIRANARLKALQ
jgi:tol-pal system protein YbgF